MGDISYSDDCISFALESYNNIFSKFDPRELSKRSISEDFLDECKKVAQEKGGNINLNLYLKKNKRNKKDEETIKKRLKNHFIHHAELHVKEIGKIKSKGLWWFVLGIIMMIAATALDPYNDIFLLRLLNITLVPAGWFSFWEGLGKIFIDANQKEANIDFNVKMSNAKISFFDSN